MSREAYLSGFYETAVEREFSGSCRSLYQGPPWVGPSRPQQRSGPFSYLCTAQNCFRTRIGAGCAKEGLKPGFTPYPSRTAARLFLDVLSTEARLFLFTSSGWMLLPLWLRHGCPWSIGYGDPRSQKRDLGHPSRVSDAVRSGDHVRAEAQVPFSSLEKRAFPQPA
jgi:hypothetical protein